MPRHEYKTVPSPRRAGRHKGVKGRAATFARTVEEALSAEAVDGWEFLRAETLPCEEGGGLFGRRREVLHTVLVFRREIPARGAAAAHPQAHPAARLQPAAEAAPAPAAPLSAPPAAAPAEAAARSEAQAEARPSGVSAPLRLDRAATRLAAASEEADGREAEPRDAEPPRPRLGPATA